MRGAGGEVRGAGRAAFITTCHAQRSEASNRRQACRPVMVSLPNH